MMQMQTKLCYLLHEFSKDANSHKINRLNELPPELLIRIASFAKESLPNLRLTSKQIERSLSKSIKKAIFPNRNVASLISPTYLKPCRLENLEELEFRDHQNSDELKYEEIPFDELKNEEIPFYANIKKVEFKSNLRMPNHFVQSLSSWPNLKVLKLGDCSEITSCSWNKLFNDSLAIDELHINRISSSHQNIEITKTLDLRLLEIDHVVNSDEHFFGQIVKKSPFLEVLELTRFTCIFNSVIANIRSCNLTKLSLSYNSFGKTELLKIDFPLFFNLLKRNQQLIKLSLQNQKYYPPSYLPVKLISGDFALPNLRILQLTYYNMKEMSWAIGCASQLEELNLDFCKGFKDIQYKSTENFPQLKILKMHRCGDFDCNFIDNLTSGNNLTKIFIEDCFVSKKMWEKINFENLREFHYEEYTEKRFFDFSSFLDIGNLLRKMPNLHKFHMANVNKYNTIDTQEENFGDLSCVFQNLRDFSIKDLKFPNLAILCLLDKLPNLETITLTLMKKVTDEIVPQLFYNCPKLQKVTIEYCNNSSFCNIFTRLNKGLLPPNAGEIFRERRPY